MRLLTLEHGCAEAEQGPDNMMEMLGNGSRRSGQHRLGRWATSAKLRLFLREQSRYQRWSRLGRRGARSCSLTMLAENDKVGRVSRKATEGSLESQGRSRERDSSGSHNRWLNWGQWDWGWQVF